MDAGKFYLDCPYEEKDMCKSLGGSWDGDMSMWFVPESRDKTEFRRWWFENEATRNNNAKKRRHLELVKTN